MAYITTKAGIVLAGHNTSENMKIPAGKYATVVFRTVQDLLSKILINASTIICKLEFKSLSQFFQRRRHFSTIIGDRFILVNKSVPYYCILSKNTR